MRTSNKLLAALAVCMQVTAVVLLVYGAVEVAHPYTVVAAFTEGDCAVDSTAIHTLTDECDGREAACLQIRVSFNRTHGDDQSGVLLFENELELFGDVDCTVLPCRDSLEESMAEAQRRQAETPVGERVPCRHSEYPRAGEAVRHLKTRLTEVVLVILGPILLLCMPCFMCAAGDDDDACFTRASAVVSCVMICCTPWMEKAQEAYEPVAASAAAGGGSGAMELATFGDTRTRPARPGGFRAGDNSV